ncbi:MAG: M15 family metallopeptidase [Bacteroidota bacterium]
MRRIVLLLLVAYYSASAAVAQHKPHVLSVQDYTKQIKTVPDKRLVEIIKAIPAIKLDIKYATTNNFMHRVMYAQARAFARAPVVEALKQVQAELKLKGLGLKIYDAYRPYAVTVDFYKMAPDTNFVADPKYGSKHNRGCAIDLSVIDLKTGKELNMPTPFDSFSRKAATDYADLPADEIQNREMLKTVMQAHGFTALRTEWWHFDFNGWQAYELLDVPFGSL